MIDVSMTINLFKLTVLLDANYIKKNCSFGRLILISEICMNDSFIQITEIKYNCHYSSLLFYA